MAIRQFHAKSGRVHVFWPLDLSPTIVEDPIGFKHTIVAQVTSDYSNVLVYLFPEQRPVTVPLICTVQLISTYNFSSPNFMSKWDIGIAAYKELTNTWSTALLSDVYIPLDYGPGAGGVYVGKYDIDMKSLLTIDDDTTHVRVRMKRLDTKAEQGGDPDAEDIWQVLGFSDEVQAY